jgi:hypothetical protein
MPPSGFPSRRHPGRSRRRAYAPGLERMEDRRLLALLTVATTADTGVGSLREAIATANLDPAPDTIGFAPAVTGTITLQTALPELSTTIVLEGPGASALTVARSSAEGTPAFRVITVAAFVEVAVSGLTLAGGRAQEGGGLFNAGLLTVTDSTLSDNLALAGGGIFNQGTLTINASTFSGNSAVGAGGGISNSGTLTVNASTLSGNSALSGHSNAAGVGGGISNSGTLTVNASTLSGNSASGTSSSVSGSGGGIFNSGTLTVTDSTLNGNSATNNNIGSDSGSGGGIANTTFGTLTVTDSTLSGNSATGPSGAGGGISNSGTVTVTDSTLSGNSAFGGGGIDNHDTLTVNTSTLSGNSASVGGAIANSGTLMVTASTLSGNSAVGGTGGGIENFGTLTVNASTLSGNTADSGGGVRNSISSAYATLINSIFAGGTGGTLVNNGGTIISAGHNLFDDAPDLALDPTDLINTDPLLAPLGDNGGLTFTHALRPGSPALDAGVAVPRVPADQRGVPRPQGAAPDIGAFEHVERPFIQLTPATATKPVGVTHTVTATVRDEDFRPLAGVPVMFRVLAGPNSGTTGTTVPADGLTDVGGRVRFTYPGDGGVGTDVITATASLPGGPTIDTPAVTVDWATPMVTNTNDSGPGSLRAAIVVANLDPARDTIEFDPSVSATIALVTALPNLDADVIVRGPGASVLTVARSSAPGNARVPTVHRGARRRGDDLRPDSHGRSGPGGRWHLQRRVADGHRLHPQR